MCMRSPRSADAWREQWGRSVEVDLWKLSPSQFALVNFHLHVALLSFMNFFSTQSPDQYIDRDHFTIDVGVQRGALRLSAEVNKSGAPSLISILRESGLDACAQLLQVYCNALLRDRTPESQFREALSIVCIVKRSDAG